MKPRSTAKPVKLDKGLQNIILADVFPGAVKQLIETANIMKKKVPQPPTDIIESVHIDPEKPQRHTNGKPAASDPNAFKVTKDIAMPTAPPQDPRPELKNLSTEKPVFHAAKFCNIPLHEIICSGIAYYAMGGYNRQGIGTAKQFVAVMGAASWAIYIGTPLQSIEVIAAEGDKVVMEHHVEQLIDCDDTIFHYRF